MSRAFRNWKKVHLISFLIRVSGPWVLTLIWFASMLFGFRQQRPLWYWASLLGWATLWTGGMAALVNNEANYDARRKARFKHE